jgi:hypothetical protein
MEITGRGQSETTGVIALVAVTLVVTASAGVWLFATTDGLDGLAGVADGQSSLAVDYADGNVTVTLEAGSAVAVDDTAVVLDAGGESSRLLLSSFTEVSGDGDGTLEAGETFRHPFTPAGERLRASFVDLDANVVFFETTRTVDLVLEASIGVTGSGSAPTDRRFTATASGGVQRAPAIDFSAKTVESYAGSQDAAANSSTFADGYGIGVYEDSWRAVPLSYDVTEDTVLAFEFRTDDAAEIHGIGLDDDTNMNEDRIFALHGSQHWGNRSFHGQYTTGDGWQTYRIPVGEAYTGQVNYLALITDGDADLGESEFRNVRVYEADGEPTYTYEWAVDGLGTRRGSDVNYTFVSGGTYSVDLTVTDAAGNSVTRSRTVTVGSAPAPLNFSGLTVEPWEPSQDRAGGLTVSSDGYRVTLANNTWKRVELPSTCTVTSDTVLAFEFRGHDQGEIHGIGFDDSRSVTAGHVFKLWGTQGWGIDDYETYQAGDGWRGYVVPVGEHYTGSFDHLVFANDDDDEQMAVSNFRNVSVYEDTGSGYAQTCTT